MTTPYNAFNELLERREEAKKFFSTVSLIQLVAAIVYIVLVIAAVCDRRPCLSPVTLSAMLLPVIHYLQRLVLHCTGYSSEEQTVYGTTCQCMNRLAFFAPLVATVVATYLIGASPFYREAGAESMVIALNTFLILEVVAMYLGKHHDKLDRLVEESISPAS